jgi:SM-20-related protein
MPGADFFTRLGLFAVKGYFDPDLCARVRSELRSASALPATVRKVSDAYVVDQSVRRTNYLTVSADTKSLVAARLRAVQPALERHFRMTFTGCENVQFLRYAPGDFFLPHQDSSSDPEAPKFARERRVSIVLFLNGQTEEPGADSYGGGCLTFYGLFDDPRWKTYGFPLTGEEGLLIAFRSDVFHEVTPVAHGERCTIVTWFV